MNNIDTRCLIIITIIIIIPFIFKHDSPRRHWSTAPAPRGLGLGLGLAHGVAPGLAHGVAPGLAPGLGLVGTAGAQRAASWRVTALL